MSSFDSEPYSIFIAFLETLKAKEPSGVKCARLAFLLSSLMYNILGFFNEVFVQSDNFSTEGVLISEPYYEMKIHWNLVLYGLSLINEQYLQSDKALADYIKNNIQFVIVNPEKYENAKIAIQNYLFYRYKDGWNTPFSPTLLPNYPETIKIDQIQDIAHFSNPKGFTLIEGQNVGGGAWKSVVEPFKIDPTIVQHFESMYQVLNFNAEIQQTFNKSLNLTTSEKVIAEFWEGTENHVAPPLFWVVFLTYLFKSSETSEYETQCRYYNYFCSGLFATSITVWTVKFDIMQARPIQTIRTIKGVPITYHNGKQTISDLWNSYVSTVPLGFPDYVSGHSTFSSYASFIFRELFGDEIFENEVLLDEQGMMLLTDMLEGTSAPYDLRTLTVPKGTVLSDGTVLQEPEPLNLLTWAHAANQCSLSRFYGGIHYLTSCKMGTTMGKYMYENTNLEMGFTLIKKGT